MLFHLQVGKDSHGFFDVCFHGFLYRADDIGEKELLVVSFGTSFNDSRAKDIGGIEKALADAYPDWSVRRAFTAQIIINHVTHQNHIIVK